MKRRAVLIGAAAATMAGTIEPVHAIARISKRSVLFWEIQIDFQSDAIRVFRRFSDGDLQVVWVPRTWLLDNVELASTYADREADVHAFFAAMDAHLAANCFTVPSPLS